MTAKRYKLDEWFKIDQVIDYITSAATDWHLKHNEAVIRKKVNEELDKSLHQLTAKLLGFDNHWGKWEIDHCNGRAGQSDAGKYFSQVAKDEIQKWFRSVKLPPMTKAIQNAAIREYKSNLAFEATKMLRIHAARDAEKIVDEILESMGKSKLAEKHIKLLKLIEGVNTDTENK